MTPWLLTLVPLVIGLTGWVVRALIIDRIKGLEEANIRQGERLGKLEQAQAVETAVREFSGRVKP